MGNEMSLSEADLRAGPDDLQARVRAGANANKRMLFPHDVGPLPKGCKCTPLGFAVLSWNQQLLDALLAVGANPDKPVGLPVRFDFTPLQLAVALGFASGVRTLLQRGADPNALLQPKRSGQPPPLQPVTHHRQRHLLRSGDAAGGAGGGGGTSATAAVPLAPQLLLPDCLARAKPGDAPLHVAIDCASGPGVTPDSVGGSRMEVVEALIGHAATDLNRSNARGRTPLYKACKRRIEVFVALLATHPGVDVNAGRPLYAAIKVESPQLVRALLHAGAACAVQDEHGRTPLSYALRQDSSRGGKESGFPGRADIVRMLVQAGSRVYPEMLSFAEERGWQAVMAALREGLPPLQVAAAAPACGGTGSGSGPTGLDRADGGGAGGGETWSEVVAAARHGSVAPGDLRPPPQRPMDAVTSALMRLVRDQQQRRANNNSSTSGGSGPNSTSSTRPGSRVSISNSIGGGNGGPSRHASVAASPSGAARIPSAPAAAAPPRRWIRAAASSSSSPWLWRPAARRSSVIGDVFRSNPILVIFAPVMIPILMIEGMALCLVAIAEAIKYAIIVLLCVMVFLSPAVLYALYTAVRGLSWLMCLAFGGGCGDGATSDSESAGKPKANQGGSVGMVVPASPAVLSGCRAVILGSNTAAAAADSSLMADLGRPMVDALEAVAAGTTEAVLSSSASSAAREQSPTTVLQPFLCNLMQPASPQPTAAEAVAGAATGAAATAESGAAISLGDATVGNGGWGVVHILWALWKGYLGICIAIAAWLLAMVAVRLCIDGVVTLLRRHLPQRSQLATFLTERARSRRNGGSGGGSASRSETGWEALFLLLALLCRMFKGSSFLALLQGIGAGTALEALVVLVYGYVQQYGRTSPLRDVSSSTQLVATPPSPLPATAADGRDAALSGPSGDGGSSAAVRAPEGISGGLEGMCCVCMNARAVVGFVHRDVVHCCMCNECEAALRRRGALGKCLICKRAATAVTKVIVT